MRLPFVIVAVGLSILSVSMSPAAEKPVPGKQVAQDFVARGAKEPSASYLLFLPNGYGKSKKKWPLIFFLHGRGESYGPLSLVKKWGPPKHVEKNPDFPYVVVSPQCPGKESWNQPRQQEILASLLDDVISEYDVDEDLIYLTGLSMGGYGSWTLAANHPDRFAAVVPICGGGNPDDAAKLKPLPIWVFHGDKDNAVPIRKSQDMVDAIRQAGSDTIKFTIYKGVGHNSWSEAYATPELYQWLDQQSASANKKRRPTDKE